MSELDDDLIDGQKTLRTELLPTLKSLVDAARDLSAKAAAMSSAQRTCSIVNVEQLRVANELLATATNTFAVLMTHGMDLAKHTMERDP